MKCKSVYFSGHAITRMFDRALSKDVVVRAIENGEVIAEYPDDQPYPSSLLLDYQDDKPLHVVVARDKNSYSCYVVTAYIPSDLLWEAGYRVRKSK